MYAHIVKYKKIMHKICKLVFSVDIKNYSCYHRPDLS